MWIFLSFRLLFAHSFQFRNFCRVCLPPLCQTNSSVRKLKRSFGLYLFVLFIYKSNLSFAKLVFLQLGRFHLFSSCLDLSTSIADVDFDEWNLCAQSTIIFATHNSMRRTSEGQKASTIYRSKVFSSKDFVLSKMSRFSNIMAAFFVDSVDWARLCNISK